MKSLNGIRALIITFSCLLFFGAIGVSFFQTDHEKEFMENFALWISADGQQVRLTPFEDEEEQIYYLVLPSGLKDKDAEFTIAYEKGMKEFRLDGISYKPGDTFRLTDEVYEAARAMDMEVSGVFGISYMDKPLMILCSENLPSLMITVEDAETILDEEAFEKKKYVEKGELLILNENGNFTGRYDLEQFKLRGNLTAALGKKPFKFVLEEPVEMFGMAPAEKWNLLANATDGSYMRNKLVLDLANRTTEDYEADGEFAELYLNGCYQGLYLLTEAVEIGENRLNIFPEDHYFLEMELDFRMEEDISYVITERGQIFAINSDKYVSKQAQEQIRDFLNDIESALFSETGVSKVSGKPLEELIDLDSWTEAWLIQEISGDHDTGIASQFSYTGMQQGDRKLYAGPVWDFDGTMGNVNTPMYKNPQALTTSIEQTRPEGNANQNRWLAAMYRNEKFRMALEEKYNTVFDEELQKLIATDIDVHVNKIRQSAVLDALRWHTQRLSWQFVLPKDLYIAEEGGYRRYDTLDSHIAMVREFLTAKRTFLYGLFAEHRDYCIVEIRNGAPFLNQDYNQTLYDWVEKGTAIAELPEYTAEGYEFKGYYDVETGRQVLNSTPIYKDLVLEGIWERTGEN